MGQQKDDNIPANQRTDERYIEMLLTPIKECAKYRPAFGKSKKMGRGASKSVRATADDVDTDTGAEDEGEEAGEGVTVEQFRSLYGADLLYHWVGLDSDLMYAAHKAAGGMTSIYRQLGIGCERLLRAIVRDELKLTEGQVKWSYNYEKQPGENATHTLDLRIDVADLSKQEDKDRLIKWLKESGKALELSEDRVKALRGVVMEIRQGYKSADSKRQNADLRFGMRASNDNYLPSVVVVSSQVNKTVERRYRNSQLLILVGAGGEATKRTCACFQEVVGYDLAAFFERNSQKLREEFGKVLKALLTPS